MEKKLFFIYLFLGCCSLHSLAQVAIKNQPAAQYWASISNAVKKQRPTNEALLAMKAQTNFTAAFADTLKKYDWVDLGSYSYYEKSFSPYWGVENTQYDIARYHESTAGELSFMLVKDRNNQSTLYHTNFTNPPPSKLVKVFKGSDGYWYIEKSAYDESEYIKLVSYQSGLLVIDIAKYGQVGEAAFFRSVLLAIPKAFVWDFD
ncbi:MAG: hypothetical protein EAZ55_00695 [Cytophagales bacterium]|nr:MAG: hypothetical protein EAZ55_00695 [Cytophagales bacterium]